MLRPASRSNLTALALAGLLVSGCAGAYRFDDSSPAVSLRPTAVMSLRWQRRLVQRRFLDYRPQEWAAATLDARGTLYVGSSARRFLAIEASGRVRWSFPTGGGISSRPLYVSSRDTVYFGANDGKLYALDARTGQLRWSYTTQGTILHPPAEAAGLLLFTTNEDRVYAIDAATGKWRWQYEREAPEGFTIDGHAGVTVHGGMAYTGFSDGVVAALRVTSGEVVWTRSLGGDNPEKRFLDVDATPVIAGRQLVTATYSGGVFALSPENGSVRWHFPVEGASSVAARGGRLFLAAPRVGLVALDLSGRQLWRQALAKGVPSAPVVAGPYVFLTGTEMGLCVASARSGRLLQVFDPGYGISAPPTVGQGVVAVLSNEGGFYALGMQ
ncbi:MAG: PQQ-binding-like beta-propeller repeat protein [Deltaproteobacteria bacterium]|nr:PQQ-binding-like beta-propeller repeat protein [Deltaproteobacteria bacterium]